MFIIIILIHSHELYEKLIVCDTLPVINFWFTHPTVNNLKWFFDSSWIWGVDPLLVWFLNRTFRMTVSNDTTSPATFTHHLSELMTIQEAFGWTIPTTVYWNLCDPNTAVGILNKFIKYLPYLCVYTKINPCT